MFNNPVEKGEKKIQDVDENWLFKHKVPKWRGAERLID